MTARASLLGAALFAAGLGAQTPPPVSGIDLRHLDRRVRPQDDLFRFANGGWIDRTTIPEEATTWTAGTELAFKVETDLRAIVEALERGPTRSQGSPEQQIVDLYASMMDADRREALGDAPIRAELETIDAADSMRDISAEAGRLAFLGAAGPFGTTLAIDISAPRSPTVRLTPGGILLPSPEYYTSDEPALVAVREGYARYLATIFRLTRRQDPGGDAERVMAFETALARAHPSPSAIAGAVFRGMTIADLAREMPGFDWAAWAEPQGIPRSRALLVGHDSFFRAFADLARTQPIETWRAWLAARYITAQAPYLSDAFQRARFEFFGRELTGQEEPRDLWRRGVSLVNAYLADAMGRLYVERHFPSSSRSRVERIVDRVVRAYRTALADESWLSEPSRREADRKIVAMARKVGYPPRWRSYRGLLIRPGDLVGNITRAKRFETTVRVRTGGAPAGGWLMPPQVVNAYYNPGLNEIVLPAAILQPPYFNPAADEAVNFGAIGAVIGHEIGHGFLGPGRFVDADGRARDWWTAEDVAALEGLTRPLVDRYERSVPPEGLTASGVRVLDEHVGDLSGLSIAYRAYRDWLEGREAPVIDGFTGDQRFFLGWAQIWRSKVREEYWRQWLAMTRHPPGEFRANGVVVHMEAFYAAFGVVENDRMFVPSRARVRIW